MATEQQHFLACRAFVRRVFDVVNTWLYNYDIWYSFSVFDFGIELEAQLSHYETHCSKRFILRKFVDRKKTRCSYTARWFEQGVNIPSSINTIVVLAIVSYSLQHFSSSKGSNKAHSIDFDRLLQSKHPCLLCLLSVLSWKLTNYDVTKASSDNFPTFPRTVPFVLRRKRAIFNVEYLGDVSMKSCKTLDYDYLDYNLLF